ncbi:MAG: hypothetical protein ACW98D_19375 [Promethearchaeota archaeon]|jgi:hypothetical protein
MDRNGILGALAAFFLLAILFTPKNSNLSGTFLGIGLSFGFLWFITKKG